MSAEASFGSSRAEAAHLAVLCRAALLYATVPSHSNHNSIIAHQSSSNGYSSLAEPKLSLKDGVLDVVDVTLQRRFRLGGLDLCSRSEHGESRS